MSARETLGSICSAIVDCEHKTAPIDDAGDFFAVGTPAMRGNVIDYSQARRISRATFDLWTRRLRPADGDLLFAREAPVGPIVRIPKTGIVAPGQRTVLLRPDPSKVDSNFLFYLLSSPTQQQLIAAKAAGSTVAHLNVADVRSFELPALPDIREQQAIAEVLGALDDKIAANARLTVSIDELLDAHFDGATRGATQGKLAEIAEVNGITVTPGQGQIRYIDIASVGVGSYECPAPTDWSSAPGRARRGVSEGDTVWSTVRPNRRSHALVLETGRDIVASTGLAVITPREGDFAFVYESTRTGQFTAFLESVAEGSAYPAVKATRFAEAPIPLPSVEKRLAFEALAAPLRRRAHAAAMESRSLAKTRDELLPLLMSGKVRVKDAEKVVEGVV